MAKKSAIQKNLMRQALADKYAARRAQLKKTSRDLTLTPEERFKAVVKLSELPRNSNQNRVRLRCELSGRPRGNYRKFKLSRIAIRELGSEGLIPGLKKASW